MNENNNILSNIYTNIAMDKDMEFSMRMNCFVILAEKSIDTIRTPDV